VRETGGYGKRLFRMKTKRRKKGGVQLKRKVGLVKT
jgi:hypothetical protein